MGVPLTPLGAKMPIKVLILIIFISITATNCKKRANSTYNEILSVFSFSKNPSKIINDLPSSQFTPEFKNQIKSTIKIQYIQDNPEFPLHGTGFFINDRGYFLTNYHIAQNCLTNEKQVLNGYDAKNIDQFLSCDNFTVSMPQINTNKENNNDKKGKYSISELKAIKVSLVSIPKFDDVCLQVNEITSPTITTKKATEISYALGKVSSAKRKALIKNCQEKKTWPKKSNDFALMHVELNQPTTYLTLDPAVPSIGSDIYLLGYPGLYCGNENYSVNELIDPVSSKTIKQRLQKTIKLVKPKYRNENRTRNLIHVAELEIETLILIKAIKLFIQGNDLTMLLDGLRQIKSEFFESPEYELQNIPYYYFQNLSLYMNINQTLSLEDEDLAAHLKDVFQTNGIFRIITILNSLKTQSEVTLDNPAINIQFSNFVAFLEGKEFETDDQSKELSEEQNQALLTLIDSSNENWDDQLSSVLESYQHQLKLFTKPEYANLDINNCYGILSKFNGNLHAKDSLITTSTTAHTISGTSGSPVFNQDGGVFAIHFSAVKYVLTNNGTESSVIESNEVKINTLLRYWRSKWYWDLFSVKLFWAVKGK